MMMMMTIQMQPLKKDNLMLLMLIKTNIKICQLNNRKKNLNLINLNRFFSFI